MYKFLIIFFLIWALSVFAQKTSVNLEFSRLHDYAKLQSPFMIQIQNDYRSRQSERNIELQLSNPELEWETEKLQDIHTQDRDSEMILALKKEFAMPWKYAHKKSAWDHIMAGALYEKKQNELDVLAYLKMGYVNIQLIEKKRQSLQQFFNILERASRITRDRKSEGAISGLENDVLAASLNNLGAKLVLLEKQQRDVLSSWKVAMGLKGEQEIHLTSPVNYVAIDLDTLNFERNNYALKALAENNTAQQYTVQEHKISFLPHITAFGGYKRAGDRMEGYIAGISLPVPLLNRNKSQVQQAKIQLSKLDTERSLQLQILAEEVNNRRSFIVSLAEYLENSEPGETMVTNLIYAYQEGWLSLNELLSGSEVYANAIDQYYEMLMLYYENIFELETIVNLELIFF
ncbi:TolC family protein [candidate division KSB1 bacterium]|nr:TolC family protein [candidate division KSB1 bacterium]